MFLKYLFFFAFAVLGTRCDSSEELLDITSGEAAEFMKTLVAFGYEVDKLGMISKMVEEFSNEKQNLSIIGWQNVVGQDGSYEAVRAITLDLPKLNKIHKEEDEEVDFEDFEKILNVFKTLSSIGLPIEVSHIEYNEDGSVAEKIYIDEDTQYNYQGGLAFLNKTFVVHDKTQIEKTVKEHSEDVLPVSILKFDSEGNFVEEGSKLVEELYVQILSEEDSTEEMLEAVIHGIGTIAVQHITETEKIPKSLAAYLHKKFPNYIFHVTTDVDGYYISKDVYITAEFSMTNYDTPNTEYHIFGFRPPKAEK